MKYLYFILAIGLFCSCFKNDPIPIPAYIYVDNMQFEVLDPDNQGSASSHIKDAWVSVDGQLLGANNFPVRFPVILNDSFPVNNIRIAAGIEDNGISNERVPYPFYARFEVNKTLVSGVTDTFYPVVHYDPNCFVKVVEDFEGSGVNFGYDIDNNPATTVIPTQESVFEGSHSGLLVFDSVETVLQVATSKYGDLQGTSTAFPVYVEMNYKTNLALEVGMVSFNNDNTQKEVIFLGGVRPSSEWKKIYFNFTTTIFTMEAPKHALTFRAFKVDSVAAPKVYLDNIKILHY